MPYNQPALVSLLRQVRDRFSDKDIWVYSGFRFEELIGIENSFGRCECTNEFLSLIDVLVDDRFILEQKDLTLKFRGSRNQRILDVPASLKAGKAVMKEQFPC